MVPDLGRLLLNRHTRRGRPAKGLVFPNSKGNQYERNYSWKLDAVLEAAGVAKKGRSCHAFRHAAAISAASGVWGDKWSQDEVAKLLRDTSDAVRVYFDILGSAMQAKANNVVSLLDQWSEKDDAPYQDVESADHTVGAGNEIRTHDFNLGKVALYH